MAVIWTPTGAYSSTNYRSEATTKAHLSGAVRPFWAQSIYLDVKRKIGTKGGLRNIPDGYLLDLNGLKPRLDQDNNELASHDPLRHDAVQWLDFLSHLVRKPDYKTMISMNSNQSSRQGPLRAVCALA